MHELICDEKYVFKKKFGSVLSYLLIIGHLLKE